MSFLLLMAAVAAFSWVVSFVLRHPASLRDAMRFGAVGAFLFTGVDHFISVDVRYLPMMPAFFGGLARPLVLVTGAAEIAGAIGLLVPLSAYRRLGLPNLRHAAGIALAVMLAFLVIANINVALKGVGVDGLPFARWYFWARPAFQPLIIIWVLYAAGVTSRATIGGARPPQWRRGETVRELLRWQWNGYRHTHQSRTNFVIHLLTVPVFIMGTCAIVAAVVTLSSLWGAAGMSAMGLAMALQGVGHRLEPYSPAPFTGPGNAALRIMLEQWVTFPRYVVSRVSAQSE